MVFCVETSAVSLCVLHMMLLRVFAYHYVGLSLYFRNLNAFKCLKYNPKMHQNRRQSFVHFYASDCDTRDGQMTTVSLVKCVDFSRIYSRTPTLLTSSCLVCILSFVVDYWDKRCEWVSAWICIAHACCTPRLPSPHWPIFTLLTFDTERKFPPLPFRPLTLPPTPHK